MSNVGDKIYEVSNESFTNLANTVNDPSTGLATKVDQLENNPVYTTASAHRTDFNYPAGYPIIRNGRLEYSNKATSGSYVAADWDAVTRSNGDPITVVSGSVELTWSITGGVPTLEVTDGTDTKQFTWGVSSGRLGMPNSGAVADAGDNDALAKKDVAATSDRVTWDDAEKRLTQVDEPTDTASDGKDLLVKKDGDDLYVEKNVTGNVTNTVVNVVNDTSVTIGASCDGTTGSVAYSPVAKRLVQDTVPGSVADNDTHMLTKFDGDNLYRTNSDYPTGEVFCLGVLAVSAGSTSTITAHGFKWATPTIGTASQTTEANNMDYVEFTFTGYKPTDMTLDAIWLDWSWTERDNLGFALGISMDTAGTDATIRLYSADNSDWSGDNVMGFDDMTFYVKVMAVASA